MLFFSKFAKVLKAIHVGSQRILAHSLLKAEAKERAAALALVIPDLTNALSSATTVGQQMADAARQELDAAAKATAAAQKKQKDGEKYLAAVKLLSK